MKIYKNDFFIIFILLLGFSTACRRDNKILLAAVQPQGNETYVNPVFLPVFADPSVIKTGEGVFYAYGTEDKWDATGSSHVVPVIRSADLVHWEYVRDAFNDKPSWKQPASVWAPDINRVNEKYFLYYSLSKWDDPNPGIGLATSDSPEGPFTDQGKLFLSDEIGVRNSIDPFFIEDNGTKYLFWGSFHGIYGIALTDDGRKVAGDKFQIAGNWMEGTCIVKRNNFYYLFGSSGYCCRGAESNYKVLIGRSESIKGPYVNKAGESLLDHEGSLFLQGNSSGGFAGPGHNAEIVTDDAGDDWLLYHGIDKNFPFLPNGATKRPLLLDKISWTQGWPEIHSTEPGTAAQSKPAFHFTLTK